MTEADIVKVMDGWEELKTKHADVGAGDVEADTFFQFHMAQSMRLGRKSRISSAPEVWQLHYGLGMSGEENDAAREAAFELAQYARKSAGVFMCVPERLEEFASSALWRVT